MAVSPMATGNTPEYSEHSEHFGRGISWSLACLERGCTLPIERAAPEEMIQPW